MIIMIILVTMIPQVDDVDNDDNINNEDNEHSGSHILKRLMRPSPKNFLSIFYHIFPSL